MNKLSFKEIRFPVLVVLFVLTIFSSCKKEDPYIDPNDNPGTGDVVIVAEETVPSSGGQVVVSAPGNPVDGMIINVPSNSYPDARDFEIQTVEITSHNLGDHFNPLTPLITIGNGGGYSDSLMLVTIPISLPEGHFAMGFYYDDLTGLLQGIPVYELTSNSITLAMRHFTRGSDMSAVSSSTKSNKSIASTCNLLISSDSISKLMGIPIISTGFKPGIDDFEFPNYGSYIAPGGHCAGQSISMMWYFYEKKLYNSPQLNGTYQLLDSLWLDNPLYYRWASVVQRDLDWKGDMQRLLKKIRITDEYHYLSWLSFAYSMLITGHPQYVGLTSLTGGHAILAHKISPTKGILYVTDPNFPGEEREIKFENDKFSPYNSKQNAEQIDSSSYTGVGYTAVSALIDWEQIGKRYSEVLDGTIGNNAPNAFPEYTIWVNDEKWQKLTDGFISKSDTLNFVVECPTAENPKVVDGKKLTSFAIFDVTGERIDYWFPNSFQSVIILKPGVNKLGFYIDGTRNNYYYPGTQELKENFIDFKWFEVSSNNLSLVFDPNPVSGVEGEQTVVTVVTGGTTPSNPKYTWNFGDGTGSYNSTSGSVYYTWASAGTYTITVSLYDNATNTLLGSATGTATITGESVSGYLNDLQQSESFSCSFSVAATTVSKKLGTDYDETLYLGYGCANNEMKWNGTHFSYSRDSTWDQGSWEEKAHSSTSFEGEISEDGQILKSFRGESEYFENNNHTGKRSSFSLSNVQLTEVVKHTAFNKWISTEYRYEAKGSDVQSHVSNVSYSRFLIYAYEDYDEFSIKSLNYNDPVSTPGITISFISPAPE
ncbi:MAG: PKD domain-containing protein [Prolixibacteraceae bacterium]|nr:PKD domain-containing protein [Prolixibacteraceae bacterium]